jgi:hypothetical protein
MGEPLGDEHFFEEAAFRHELRKALKVAMRQGEGVKA